MNQCEYPPSPVHRVPLADNFPARQFEGMRRGTRRITVGSKGAAWLLTDRSAAVA